MDKSIQPDTTATSLYAALQSQFGSRLASARLTRSALGGVSRSLEKTIVSQRLPMIFAVNYQQASQWGREAPRYRRVSDLIELTVAFADFSHYDASVGGPNAEELELLTANCGSNELRVSLPATTPLFNDWFAIVGTPGFSVLLCGQPRAAQPRREAVRLYDTLISLEVPVIQYALDRLEQVIGEYAPEGLAKFQAARRRLPLAPPDPYYVGLLAAQFVEQVNFYRQKARQQDQQAAMRATIARLIHDASQPVTTLVSLLDFAQRIKQVAPEEIEMLLSAANQLKQILDHLRQVNRFRTSRIHGSDYLDTGAAFYPAPQETDPPEPSSPD